MTKDVKNSSVEGIKQANTNLEIGVYTIYDCVLKQFGSPISVPVTKVLDYFSMLVNDVASPYYNHESDYILNRIGTFNQDTGEIDLHFVERVCILDSFINDKTRTLQTLVRTLNYLPQGYFKMPAEQKQEIQEQINFAVKKYVEDYVIPDMDISSEKCRSLEQELQDYKQRLNVVQNN